MKNLTYTIALSEYPTLSALITFNTSEDFLMVTVYENGVILNDLDDMQTSNFISEIYEEIELIAHAKNLNISFNS